MIRYVASVIGRLGAPPRMASRYGGEEFAILFPSERTEHVMRALEIVRVEIASRMLKRRSTNEDLGTVTISGRGGPAAAGRDRALPDGAGGYGTLRFQARRPRPDHRGPVHRRRRLTAATIDGS